MPGALKKRTRRAAPGRLFRKRARKLLTYAIYNVILAAEPNKGGFAMPRPVKRRRVCEPPRNARFGPLDGAPAENVVLAVDEYENIRLIDL